MGSLYLVLPNYTKSTVHTPNSVGRVMWVLADRPVMRSESN